MCKHTTFVNENGYNVCTICGEAERNHYWNESVIDDIYNRAIPIKAQYFQITNRKWKKLLFLNQTFSETTRHYYINRETLWILELLPFSSKTKKTLYKYIINKKFKHLNEVWESFYNLICINDLPITTEEFLKMLQAVKNYKFKPLTKLQKTESVRKYYWYITKQTEKARKILGFSYEDSQRIFKIVFNYYNLIRFKMLKSVNPVYLIQNLVYYTVREKLRPNQQRFGKKNFEIKDCSYISRLVRYLEEIKYLGLDATFSEKLEINERYKRLLAKIKDYLKENSPKII